ncbi:crossover junction endodeoxyribonuclease [candidate division WWE3 bacterium]|jgi:crossover junction endodeoxyribonuclease RuvC|nr:crossover junction endodeoxyribonuclease [candidate division WWE3 bacterium]
MRNIIGIDPGLSGAVARIRENKGVDLIDIPTFYAKKKNWIDYYKLTKVISSLLNWGNNEVWIEDVHSMPKQGVASSFKFGRGFGILIGICAALKIDIKFVPPQTWKKKMNLIKTTKVQSVELANKLYNLDISVADDGKAEALLIAHYGLLKHKEDK